MRAFAALAAVALATGCTSLAARRIATPPSPAGSSMPAAMETLLGVTHDDIALADGARVAVAMLAPGRRATRYTVARDGERLRFDLHADAGRVSVATRGDTVLLLPGWGMRAAGLLPWALEFAGAGHRVVLVDLHARPRPVPVGYGPSEGRALVEVVDRLRAAGRIEGPLHVLGVSYGGAVAAWYAANATRPPASVVGIAAFGHPADAIAALARRDARAARVDLDRAIDRAGRRLGVDLRTLDTADALARTPACVGLVGGGRDDVVPPAELRRQQAHVPRATVVVAPDETHFTLPLRADWLAAPIARWMEAAAAGRCTALEVGVDPLGR